MTDQPETRRFASRGAQLSYVDWGNAAAPTLILIHGGRDQARSWDWAAQRLRSDWHVVAPDLRGHGDSADGSETRGGFFDLIDDLGALIRALGDAPVTIIGHSLGGLVALTYAGRNPDKVRKLVAIESMGVLEATRRWVQAMKAAQRTSEGASPRAASGYASLDEALSRLVSRSTHLTPDQARHIGRHSYRQNDDGRWVAKFDEGLQLNEIGEIPLTQLQAGWAAIACPALLIQGADSEFTKPTPDEHLHHFPDVRSIELAGASHWPHHQQFEAFMEAVQRFI